MLYSNGLAPGHYAPEKSVKALGYAPEYTFGTRTQIEKPADTPGKFSYNFSKVMKMILKNSRNEL